MAKGGKITRDDLISKDAIKVFEEMKSVVDALVKSVKKLTEENRKTNKALKKAEGFKEVNKQTKEAAKNVKKLTDAEKKLQSATKRLSFELSKEGKEYAKLTEQTRRARKANADFARSQLAGVKSTNRFSKAIGSFLFKANFLANVMSNVARVITRTFVKAIRGTFDIVTGFEQAMADVRSITKATGVEFEQLSQSARALGASTKFTAIQVAQLQKEYAKLGFSTQEILNASEATLNLAAATGSDLARAAEVAGKTLRGFGLNARETKRVTDVMAESFTSSALDIENFAESMKFVAPIAKVVNTTIETTTAILGIMADAGIVGSMAGTSLRKIFGELVGEGGNLTEVLLKLSKTEISLADAQKLVGERARTSLLVLLDNIEKLPEFTKALEDSGGAAERMADIQLDTMIGKLTELKSAYQGIIQVINESSEFMEAAKSIVEEFTGGILGLTNTLEEKLAPILRAATRDAQEFIKSIEDKDTEDQVASVTDRIKEQAKILLIRADVVNDYIAELDTLGRKEAKNQLAWIREEKTRLRILKQSIQLLDQYRSGLQESGKEGVEILEEEIVTLGSLREELSAWKKLRNEVSISEIKAVDVEISKIKEKIQVIEDSVSVLPSVKEILFDDDIDMDAVLADIEADADRIAELIINKGEETEAEKTRNFIKWVRLRFRKENELEEKQENKKLALKKKIANEGFSFLSALTDRALENSQLAINTELASLEERFRKELIDRDQFEAKKLEIERRGQEESLKLRRRAARIDKAQALFNIGLNTAIGISNAASKVVTIPLIPFITALGLAQAAFVAAKPLPKFGKGGDVKGGSHGQGGVNINAEGGEFMIKKKQVSKYRSLVEAINNDTIGKEMLFMPHIMGGEVSKDPMKETNILLNKIIDKPVDKTIIRPGGIDYIRTTRNTTVTRIESFRR